MSGKKTDNNSVKMFRSSDEQLNYRCESSKLTTIDRCELLKSTPVDPLPLPQKELPNEPKQKVPEEQKTENINAEWIRISTPELYQSIEFKSNEAKAVSVN